MKKIALCSLIVVISGFFYTNNVFAAGEMCSSITGTTICGEIPNRGGPESKICKNSKGAWLNVGDKCTPSNAPKDSGHCIKPIPGKDTISCAAKQCNNGYVLSTTKSQKWRNLPITKVINNPSYTPSEKVASNGGCWARKTFEDFCATKTDCGAGKKCVFNEIVVKNYGVDVPAWLAEETCACVDICTGGKTWNTETKECEEPKTEPETEEPETEDPETEDCPNGCIYKFTKRIKCSCGKFIEEKQTVKLKNKQEYEKARREIDALSDGDTYLGDIEKLNDVCDRLCDRDEEDEEEDDDDAMAAKVAEAHSIIKNLESGASVWKNEEGKFNTSRLISDATAGVVLGTVGGVVSSKIIKKKQLEKGYDVLHCTVGGQTVADWGDEFNVGLNR